MFLYRSLYVAGIGFLVVMFFNAFAGIIMFAHYYGCDPMQAGVSLHYYLPYIACQNIYYVSSYSWSASRTR